jgi:hypothetical protein
VCVCSIARPWKCALGMRLHVLRITRSWICTFWFGMPLFWHAVEAAYRSHPCEQTRCNYGVPATQGEQRDGPRQAGPGNWDLFGSYPAESGIPYHLFEVRDVGRTGLPGIPPGLLRSMQAVSRLGNAGATIPLVIVQSGPVRWRCPDTRRHTPRSPRARGNQTGAQDRSPRVRRRRSRNIGAQSPAPGHRVDQRNVQGVARP